MIVGVGGAPGARHGAAQAPAAIEGPGDADLGVAPVPYRIARARHPAIAGVQIQGPGIAQVDIRAHVQVARAARMRDAEKVRRDGTVVLGVQHLVAQAQRQFAIVVLDACGAVDGARILVVIRQYAVAQLAHRAAVTAVQVPFEACILDITVADGGRPRPQRPAARVRVVGTRLQGRLAPGLAKAARNVLRGEAGIGADGGGSAVRGLRLQGQGGEQEDTAQQGFSRKVAVRWHGSRLRICWQRPSRHVALMVAINKCGGLCASKATPSACSQQHAHMLTKRN